MNLIRTLPLLLVSACVTQGTYDSLKAEHESAQGALEDRNKALKSANSKIAGLETDKASLSTSLKEQQERVQELTVRIARLNAEMSSTSKDKSRLESSVQEMTAALAELEKRRAAAEARVEEYRSLLRRFQALIDAGKLKVRIIEGRMVVVLNTDILFASGSATLSKDGKAAIAEVAQVLAGISDRSFQVEGHTDNQPISTAQFPSNWELASARAINVVKAMIEAGLPSNKVSAASFGEGHPTGSNSTKEGRAQNRRIEITIVPDLSALPGFEELKRLEKNNG